MLSVLGLLSPALSPTTQLAVMCSKADGDGSWQYSHVPGAFSWHHHSLTDTIGGVKPRGEELLTCWQLNDGAARELGTEAPLRRKGSALKIPCHECQFSLPNG